MIQVLLPNGKCNKFKIVFQEVKFLRISNSKIIEWYEVNIFISVFINKIPKQGKYFTRLLSRIVFGTSKSICYLNAISTK